MAQVSNFAPNFAQQENPCDMEELEEANSHHLFYCLNPVGLYALVMQLEPGPRPEVGLRPMGLGVKTWAQA